MTSTPTGKASRPRSRLFPAAAALAASLAASLGAPPAFGGEQADRALAAVRDLVAAGEIKRDARLKVDFKAGNINSLLGPELELQGEWERRTGIMIAAHVIPQQPGMTTLKADPDVDLTVVRNHESPDLLDQGLVEDLAPLMRQFGFSLPGEPPNGYIRPRLQAYVGERMAAVPADGDVAMVYLRRDLLEDPQERAAFRKAYGRDLAIPRTWQEYDQLVAFFHRPDKGLYGTAEERDPAGGWMFWLPRYLCQSAPYRRLFDDAMRPLIDSPAGVAATESYVRTVRFSPPDVLGEGKDYSYLLPFFLQGRAFAFINTVAATKFFNAPGSAVKGKFVAVPMPGQSLGGKVLRHNLPIYGNNLVVSSRSPHPALAFLFAMWLTDPDNSLRTVGARGGFTDPYRWHHLEDRRIAELYTPGVLSVLAGEWRVALPAGTGIPGDSEYLEALDRHLWLAARGEETAAEAMRRTAAEWEKITERRGRDRQIRALQAFNAGLALKEGGQARR
ncbi:MAG TPA: extracellular solute-binding protein [Rhodocyclaceae bacterium]|nr:extracellular solute-binding protein [Rhodocyclaceae bacterium]